MVETFGTEKIGRGQIQQLIDEHFDLRPGAFREALNLHRPIYQKTAAYGHFGREDHDFTWERTDKAARCARPPAWAPRAPRSSCATSRRRRLENIGSVEEELEQAVSPLELFFDLVFVFAITQVSAFVSPDADWTRLFEGVAILTALWWAWESYVWLANTAASDEGTVRVVLLSTMGALLIASLAVPHAFGDDAWSSASPTSPCARCTSRRTRRLAGRPAAARRGGAHGDDVAPGGGAASSWPASLDGPRGPRAGSPRWRSTTSGCGRAASRLARDGRTSPSATG